MPTIDIPRPDKQGWQLGDKLWMYPPERAGGQGFATLRTYVPGRALGFGTHAVGTSVTAPENESWAAEGEIFTIPRDLPHQRTRGPRRRP